MPLRKAGAPPANSVSIATLSEVIFTTVSVNNQSFYRAGRLQEDLGSENLRSNVVKDQTLTLLEFRTQVPSINTSMRKDCKLSYHLQMSVERPVQFHVLSVTGTAKSRRSATDTRVDNKESREKTYGPQYLA